MIDLKFLRENPDIVKENRDKRNPDKKNNRSTKKNKERGRYKKK